MKLNPIRVVTLFLACVVATVANADDATPADGEVTFQGLPVKATKELTETWRNQYEGFAEPKALAMALGEDGNWAFGWLEKAPGVLPAIGGAIQGCERARQQKGITTPCEIVGVNQEEVELGRAFAKRLGAHDATPAMVWRYQKDGRTVYLAGSMHIFKSSLYPLPAAYEKAFADSEVLFLEVNPAAIPLQDLMKLRQKHLMLPDGKTLDSVLPEPLLEEAKKDLADLGVPWSAVATLTPAALSVEFSQALFMTRGYLPQSGIDQYFLSRALQGGKTVDQLETLESQLELISQMPIDLQKAQSQTALDKMALSRKPDEILQAWYLGDLQGIAGLMTAEYDASAELKAWYRAVFQERNEKMAAKIAGLLESAPQTKMIIVGVGHLAGESNLIELLEKQGITGVRLSRDGAALN
jgi:uncharacterized protein YbaP (TraB family)